MYQRTVNGMSWHRHGARQRQPGDLSHAIVKRIGEQTERALPNGRALDWRISAKSGRFGDELDRVAKGLDRIRSVIGDLDAEFFFECHDQFDRVEAVRTEIVDERGFVDDFVLFNAQVFHNDFLNAVCDIAHVLFLVLSWAVLPVVCPRPSREVAMVLPNGRFSTT
jgi:hypothetical protein